MPVKMMTFNGETKSSKEWAEHYGVRRDLFLSWVKRKGESEAHRLAQLTEEERYEEAAINRDNAEWVDRPLPEQDPDFFLKREIENMLRVYGPQSTKAKLSMRLV